MPRLVDGVGSDDNVNLLRPVLAFVVLEVFEVRLDQQRIGISVWTLRGSRLLKLGQKLLACPHASCYFGRARLAGFHARGHLIEQTLAEAKGL